MLPLATVSANASYKMISSEVIFIERLSHGYTDVKGVNIQSQATTRGGGLRKAPKRGHRSISILTPFVAYQTYLALECISVFALHPTPLY